MCITARTSWEEAWNRCYEELGVFADETLKLACDSYDTEYERIECYWNTHTPTNSDDGLQLSQLQQADVAADYQEMKEINEQNNGEVYA